MFADIEPAISDVIKVWKNILVDHDLVHFTRVTNRIDSALSGCIDGRNTDIYGVISGNRAVRETPLRGAGGRAQTSPGKAHDATLRAAGRDICPAFGRGFHEVGGTVIYNDARGRPGRIGQRVA